MSHKCYSISTRSEILNFVSGRHRNGLLRGRKGARHYAIVALRSSAKTHYFHHWYPGICPGPTRPGTGLPEGERQDTVWRIRGFSVRRQSLPESRALGLSRPLVHLFLRSLPNHFRITRAVVSRAVCDRRELRFMTRKTCETVTYAV